MTRFWSVKTRKRWWGEILINFFWIWVSSAQPHLGDKALDRAWTSDAGTTGPVCEMQDLLLISLKTEADGRMPLLHVCFQVLSHSSPPCLVIHTLRKDCSWFLIPKLFGQQLPRHKQCRVPLSTLTFQRYMKCFSRCSPRDWGAKAALLSWRCHLDPQLTNGKRKAQNVQATSPRSQTWAIGGRG